MAEFSGTPPYIKQIALYFQQEDYQKAYELSKEFAEKYPESMASHFLLAKAAFWINDFERARDEASDAFYLASGQEELAVSGILLACSYYRLKEYEKGMELLSLLKTKLQTQENIMKLKFVFALALQDEPAAMKHLDMLYGINKKEASSLMLKLLKKETKE